MGKAIPRLVHIGREVLKNFAMGAPLVVRIRGSRVVYADMASTLDAAKQTLLLYQTHLQRYCGSQDFARGKNVLEVGPGSHLGLSLCFLARGATSAVAIDRFRNLLPSPQLQDIHRAVTDLWPKGMQDGVRELLNQPREAFERRGGRLCYFQVPVEDAARHIVQRFEIAFSYGVLGLVTDLEATMRGLYALLAPGGVMVHRVHHGTHGVIVAGHAGMLHQYTYGPRVWNWMYSSRGGPNRLPANAYKDACQRSGFVDVEIHPDQRLTEQEVEQNRPLLHPDFRRRTTEDLATHVSVLLARRPS